MINRIIKAVLAVSVVLAILSCDNARDINPAKPVACGTCRQSNLHDDLHFTVLYPNGGEVFYIGDTARFRICSENPEVYSLDDAPKLISVDDGRTFQPVEYWMKGDTVLWVIPEATEAFDANYDIVNVSMLSETCRFKIHLYNFDPSEDSDISDSSFAIRKR